MTTSVNSEAQKHGWDYGQGYISVVLQKLLGTRLFNIIFKPTVYKNFIAGNTKKEIYETSVSLSKSGLLPLISPMIEAPPESSGYDIKVFEDNKNIVRENIEVCSSIDVNPLHPKCVAIKLTAIIPAQIVEDLTNCIGEKEIITPEMVYDMSKAFDTGDTDYLANKFSLNQEQLKRIAEFIPNINWLGIDRIDAIFLDFPLHEKLSLLGYALNYVLLLCKVVNSVYRLITLALMHIFNKEKYTFWNTYQCYLKKTEGHVHMDTKLIQDIGVRWAGKIVRGAYMQYEREKALKNKVEDPVHDDYDSTSDAYDRVAEYLLKGVAEGKDWRFILATHNEASLLKACSTYSSLSIQKNVYFGQIAGMGEALSCGLAQTGFPVYKLVPTGTVDEVLPWLSRRMAENSHMMAGAQRDRIMIQQEIKRRILKN